MKRVHLAHKENPLKGDWCELVKQDVEDQNKNMTEMDIPNMDKQKEKLYPEVWL